MNADARRDNGPQPDPPETTPDHGPDLVPGGGRDRPDVDDQESAPSAPGGSVDSGELGDTGGGRGRGSGLLRLRLTRSTILAGTLTAALGLGLSTQIQQTQQQGLEALREPELVGILDTVTERQTRLDAEARELEAERAELAQGAGGAEAVRRAAAHVDALGILVGTAPAVGPGIEVVIEAPPGAIGSETLLDAVQELRDAGAEAIQIGDVRVVASTAFTQDDAGVIHAGGTPLELPYRMVAVGEAQTLASGLDIPGGVVESLRQVGAEVTVTPGSSVHVNALHAPSPPRYARPVPVPTGAGDS